MANLLPEIPAVNAQSLYINGLQLSNDAATPNTILGVASGACRDSTNVNDIFLPATVYNPVTGIYDANPITINTARSGAGGLDAGAIAASTVYAVYAIGSSTNQIGNGQPISAYPGSAMLSTNFTTPVLPYGYDMFRRIGAIATTAASAIRPFTQVGTGATRRMMSALPLAAVTGAGSATNASATINALPFIPAISTMVHLKVSLTPATAGDTILFVPTGAATTSIYAQLSGSVAAVPTIGTLSCPCSATPQISYRGTNIAGSDGAGAGTAVPLSVWVLGYDDQL